MLVPSGTVSADTSLSDFRNAHGDFLELYDPDRTNLSAAYLIEPDMEEKGGPGGYRLQILEAAGQLAAPVTEDLFMVPGFLFQERIYDYDHESEQLGIDTLWKMELILDAGYFISPQVLWLAGVRAGAYSDMDGNTNGEDFRIFGSALVVHQSSPRFQLVIGVVSDEAFDSLAVYPLIGFRWLSPEENVHLSVTLPVEAEIRINIQPSTTLSLGGWLSGDRYHVRFEPDATERDIQVQDRRFGGGIRHWLSEHFNVEIEGGVNARSQFEVKGSGFTELFGHMDPGFFLTLGVGAAL
jgi:hypothetical protein